MEWFPTNSDLYVAKEPPYTATDRILDDLREKEAEAEMLVDQRRAALESAESDLEYIRFQMELAENGEVSA